MVLVSGLAAAGACAAAAAELQLWPQHPWARKWWLADDHLETIRRPFFQQLDDTLR